MLLFAFTFLGTSLLVKAEVVGVTTAAEFDAAINAGKSIRVDSDTIDIWTAPIEISGDKEITIDLNGKTIKGSLYVSNGSKVTIKGNGSWSKFIIVFC